MRSRWHKWPKSSQKWLLAGTNGTSAQWMSRARRVLQSGFSPAAGIQRLMPPRPPSADISLVYLPSSHRPHITNRTPAPQPGSHPSRYLTLQVFCESLVAAHLFGCRSWRIAKWNDRNLDFTNVPGKIDRMNILKPQTAPDLWRWAAESQAFN